jgi:hypothetical protein
MRLLLPAGLLAMLAGYFGPWVNHPVAGLVITGLDLGEYIKFLPAVQTGALTLWRPGFYAPLVTVAACALLVAFRPTWHYPTWARILLLAIAAVAMLNLIPPAWTPRRLLEPEFRVQTVSLALLALALVLAPWLAFLPQRVAQIIGGTLLLAAALLPAYGFLAVLPTISALYVQPLIPGWGMWLLGLGVILCAIAGVFGPRHHPVQDKS